MLPLILALAALSLPARAASSYERFQALAAERRRTHVVTGTSYLAGGAFAAGTSLALAVTADELVPKLGSTLTLALGAAAAAHGAILLREGDAITRRADELRAMAADLQRASPHLSAAQRARILDELTEQSGRRALELARREARIRGWFELGAGVALAATAVASPVGGTSANLGVGLLAIVSGAVGAADLLGRGLPEGDRLALVPSRDGPLLALTLRW